MAAIPLRRFKPNGLDALNDALDRIDLGEVVDITSLIDDDQLTEEIDWHPVVDVRPFASRYDAGQYLYELLSRYERGIPNIERDKGLWTWLAMAWIDLLAPAARDGVRQLKDRPRLVAAVDDFRTYYRHLLAGPYLIYRTHKDDPSRAMAVLATAVEKPGEVVEQFASRQDIITSKNQMSAITTLYFDSTERKLKPGASAKTGGGARRLADVLLQFGVTWDMHSMQPDDILKLLPKEFGRFLVPVSIRSKRPIRRGSGVASARSPKRSNGGGTRGGASRL